MKCYVVIPSRYGSTRFDGKPLAKIAGKPMIQHVCERSAAARGVAGVFVATDDQRIFDAVTAFGGKAVMTSDENRSGTDRVGEAAETIGIGLGDVVVNVQGDQPLLDPRCLEEVVEPFYRDPGLGMSTLAFRILREKEKTDPKDVKVTFDLFGDALYFSRSLIPWGREAGEAYDVYKHLGVYAYTRSFLDRFRQLPTGRLEQIERLEQLRAIEHGLRICVVVTEYDSPEVDLPEDVARIESLLRTG